MGELIGIVIVIGLVYLLIRYVIIPIAGILGIASLTIGAGYALVISVYSFGKSLAKHINPYTTYVDKNKDIPAGIRRSYFFGPGFHQIKVTVIDAFVNLREQSHKIIDFRRRHSHHSWYIKIWIWVAFIAAIVCAYVFGFAWMAIFSILLASVITGGMIVFYTMFTLLWTADRIILALKSIQSRCPSCKRISVVPVFICPGCGTEHKKLTPGPYGIFHRKCGCGVKLPTTFINGRSKLKAICPYCAMELAASNARQYGIQLVGGVSAGKTTFLAAFWHLYIERLNKLRYVSINVFPGQAFNGLERWYNEGLSSATSETNANMYSVIHKRTDKTPYQLTIYDIAGEAFVRLSGGMQQQQFKYCEGIVFVVDPTASPQDVNNTFSAFISEFKGLKGRHSVKMADIPAAVIISKADLRVQEIGLSVINDRYKSNPSEFSEAAATTAAAAAAKAGAGAGTGAQGSLELTRNGVCREFLMNHKYDNVLNLLDGEFSKVQYFPVSAMGHTAASGQPYQPWGVLEPVLWLLGFTDASFNEIITQLREARQ